MLELLKKVLLVSRQGGGALSQAAPLCYRLTMFGHYTAEMSVVVTLRGQGENELSLIFYISYCDLFQS